VLASPNYIFNVSAQLKALWTAAAGDTLHGVLGQVWGFGGYFRGGDEKAIVDYMNHFLTISGAVPVGGVWASMADMSKASFGECSKGRGTAWVADWSRLSGPEKCGRRRSGA